MRMRASGIQILVVCHATGYTFAELSVTKSKSSVTYPPTKLLHCNTSKEIPFNSWRLIIFTSQFFPQSIIRQYAISSKTYLQKLL